MQGTLVLPRTRRHDRCIGDAKARDAVHAQPWSTTAIGSLPILQVPTRWYVVRPVSRTVEDLFVGLHLRAGRRLLGDHVAHRRGRQCRARGARPPPPSRSARAQRKRKLMSGGALGSAARMEGAGALRALHMRVHEEALGRRHAPLVARLELDDVGADDHHDVRLLQPRARAKTRTTRIAPWPCAPLARTPAHSTHRRQPRPFLARDAGSVDGPLHGGREVVAQVLADALQFVGHRDAVPAQDLRVADARQLQQLGRVRRARCRRSLRVSRALPHRRRCGCSARRRSACPRGSARWLRHPSGS